MQAASLHHAPHFTFAGRNAVYGVLDTQNEAEELHDDLRVLGFVEAQIQILSGRAGLRELDEYGRHHGLLCRVTRVLQEITREREFIGQYAAQLRAGHLVLGLRGAGRGRLTELRDAFGRHGGHAVHHYGLLMVDVLTP
jgi:hypothetical protein